MKIEIEAGSSWGKTFTTYVVNCGILRLEQRGETHNLVGNSVANQLDGLSVSQAKKKLSDEVARIKSIGNGKGCHASQFNARIS